MNHFITLPSPSHRRYYIKELIISNLKLPLTIPAFPNNNSEIYAQNN